MKLSIDAFAYETLHGAGLVESLLREAMGSARVLRTRYERLDRAIKSAESALEDLYQIAGEVWHAEVSSAESGVPHPDGLAAAKAKATQDQCMFCEEKITQTAGRKRRWICASPACDKARETARRRDYRYRRVAA